MAYNSENEKIEKLTNTLSLKKAKDFAIRICNYKLVLSNKYNLYVLTKKDKLFLRDFYRDSKSVEEQVNLFCKRNNLTLSIILRPNNLYVVQISGRNLGINNKTVYITTNSSNVLKEVLIEAALQAWKKINK